MIAFLIIVLVATLIALAVVSSKLNASKSAYRKLGENTSKLSSELLKKDLDLDECRNKCSILDMNVQDLEEQNEVYVNTIKKRTERIEEISNELSGVKAIHEELKSKYDSAEAAYNELDRRTSKEIKELKTNNKSLSDKLLSSGNELANVRKELETNKKTVEDLSKILQELRDHNEDLTRKNKSLLSSAGGYEKANKELRIKIGAIAEEYQALKEKSMDLISTYNELVDEYNKLVGEEDKKDPVNVEEKDHEEGDVREETESEDQQEKTEVPEEVKEEDQNVATSSEEKPSEGIVSTSSKKTNIKFGKKKKNKKR